MKAVSLAFAAFALAVNAASSVTQASSSVQTSDPEAVGVIEIDNLGYTGYYYDVKSISNVDSKSCKCELSSSFTVFEGPNSPLNEELSVHFRGPLSLKLFGYYLANDSSSGSWSRYAYYDASLQSAENVTFLNNAGEDSPCLGQALTYSPTNGTGSASLANILEEDNMLESDEEYAIFSNVSCPLSGFDNSCGVYRPDIPAYHGFGGTTKLFLFEFTMPDSSLSTKNASYPNMPAIWFLNAKIPRTSQYSLSSSCSCWNSGCGELDAFEVLNKTYTNRLMATIHDYQGSDDINNGMSALDYFQRDTEGVMKGGVRFGSDGTISIFMLENISFDDSIDASDVDLWVSSAGNKDVKSLSSVTMDTSTSLKKSGGHTLEAFSWISTAVTFVLLALLYV